MTRERSEEEKRRRHLFGDKGAKFSGGKIPRLVPPVVIGTITTMITKDILLAEIYEDDNPHRLLQPYGSGQSKHRRDDCPSHGEMGDDERLEDN